MVLVGPSQFGMLHDLLCSSLWNKHAQATTVKGGNEQVCKVYGDLWPQKTVPWIREGKMGSITPISQEPSSINLLDYANDLSWVQGVILFSI